MTAEDRDDRRPEEEEAAPPAEQQEPPKERWQPYSRRTRMWAWVGIVFMVFLVIMYTYSLGSGKIMMF